MPDFSKFGGAILSGLGSRKYIGIFLMFLGTVWKGMPPELNNPDMVMALIGALLAIFGNGAKANANDAAPKPAADPVVKAVASPASDMPEPPEGFSWVLAKKA